jgi:XTP/dITP diphosphohydrolase
MKTVYLIISTIILFTTGETAEWKLNSSNKEKLQEFQRLFSQYGSHLIATDSDSDEIVSDPLTVVVHKASQLGEQILIEDTSLEVEGADIGIQIRWMLEHLSDYVGRKAHWTVLLAYQSGNQVFVYRGVVHGTIVSPQGASGFGFDPLFLPEGQQLTLAQSKPDKVNARALAVRELFENRPFAIRPPIFSWEGEWQ